MINKDMFKRVQKTTGKNKRIPIPSCIKWNDGDTVEYTIIDEDTITMKRVLKMRE